jgi:hypothetical protein
LALEKYHNVWDTQRLCVDPCVYVFEDIVRKLTIHLLCPNILAWILGHNVPGEKALVGDPACLKTHESPALLQGTMSEADTMLGFVILQVMQNAEPYHNIRTAESRVIPKRLGVPDHESSPASVHPFGRSNTSWIDVEPEIIDLWKPR